MTGFGSVKKPKFPKIQRIDDIKDAIKERREVYFEEEGFVEIDIYSRDKLGAGAEITGPAIIEQMDSTIIIPPDFLTNVDDYGNIILSR